MNGWPLPRASPKLYLKYTIKESISEWIDIMLTTVYLTINRCALTFSDFTIEKTYVFLSYGVACKQSTFAIEI